MGALVTAAALGAGASLLGSVLGLKGASNQQAYTKELMDYQHQLNSPLETRRQLEEGGFNPASMFGQSQAIQGATSLGSAPDVSGAMSSGAGLIQNAALLNAQIRNLDSQSNKNNADAGLTFEQTVAEKLRNKVLPDMLQKDLSGKDLANAIASETVGLTAANRKKVDKEADYLGTQIDAMNEQIKIFQNEVIKSHSEAEIAKMREAATPQLIQKEFQEINSRINLNGQLAQQAAAVAADALAGADQKEVETKIKQVALQYADEQQQLQTQILENEETSTYQAGEQARMETARMRAGQDTAKKLRDVAEFCGAFGQLLNGLPKVLK